MEHFFPGRDFPKSLPVDGAAVSLPVFLTDAECPIKRKKPSRSPGLGELGPK